MANDITDVLFKTVIDLIGWVIKTCFNIVIGLLKFLWKLIFSNKGKTGNSGNNRSVQESYQQLLNEINHAEKMSTDTLIDMGSRRTLANVYMTVDQKCKILEAMNNFVSGQEDGAYHYLFHNMVNHSYTYIKEMLPPDSMFGSGSDFKKEVEAGSLKSYQPYFMEIMSLAAAIGGNSITIKASQLGKYNLPEVRN